MTPTRMSTPPHDYQPAGLSPSPRYDPCAYPGCVVLRHHAIHHTDTAPRDITEPSRRPEEDQ